MLSKSSLCNMMSGKSLINGSSIEVSSLSHYKCHVIPTLHLGNWSQIHCNKVGYHAALLQLWSLPVTLRTDHLWFIF